MDTGKYRLLEGDVLQWAASYEGEPFHALLCDPPYHLTSIVKRFSNGEPEHTKTANDIKHRLTPHARQAAGFMGQQWDGGDIAFRPETWEVLGRHLYPGAFCFAFAGTRGYHRMAVAIEDAGFILHPMIVWIFGSGFPKATRIKGDVAFSEHRYGLQALKPALEPVCVFQKPYKGRPVDCITSTGAGALNIGAGRVGSGSDKMTGGNTGKTHFFDGGIVDRLPTDSSVGRWPSNVLLDECGAVALDAQSGHLQSGKPMGIRKADNQIYGRFETGTEITGFGDEGGASRFFFRSDWQAEEYDPFFYCAKSGRVERSAGLDGMPLQERTSQGRDIVTSIDRRDGKGRVPVDGKLQPSANHHPTVKPLRLTRYLSGLLLPPDIGKERRLLVPFGGVASEMIGAHLAGWDCVIGIEQSAEYCEIGRKRLDFWSGNVGLFDSLTAEDDTAEPAQAAMEI